MCCLAQERETSEKLRMRVRELELSAEQQQPAGRNELSDSQKPMTDSSQDELKRSTHDAKTWKLKARLGEEKIKELEKDVEMKVKLLSLLHL